MKTKRLRVSIVIPAYNEERHLEDCLSSIARQTVSPYEVLVVDNNSKDRTAEIARSFPFVTLVRARRQGIVHARNAGFDAASGEIIGRIDADSQLPPEWVSRVMEFYAQDYAGSKAWSGSGYLSNVRFPRFVSWLHSFFIYRFNKAVFRSDGLWGSNMAITAAQWRDIRSKTCTRTDIHEDVDLAIHLHEAGYGIIFDPDVPVTVELKRFQSDRDGLWAYLEWWPRVLRVHGRNSWPIAWILGVVCLYYASYLLVAADKITRWLTIPVRIFRWFMVQR